MPVPPPRPQDGVRESSGPDGEDLPRLREHHATYVAASWNASYDSDYPTPASLGATTSDADAFEDYEIVFQVSVRYDIADWRASDGSVLRTAAAFTTKSFWQAAIDSAPFRTTDYEPELFLEYYPAALSGDGAQVAARAGVSHQSNGEAGDVSRSWDRVFGEILCHSPGWRREESRDVEWYVALKPWLITDRQSTNEDIDEYFGDGELTLGLIFGGRSHKILLRERNALWEGDWRNGLEASYSYGPPSWNGFRLYTQIYHGYGENLLDYDDSATRFLVGFELASVLGQ